MRHKLIAAVFATAALTIPASALASRSFGPGNSQKGPHDPGALCHPPGLTKLFPACK
jgi:hypothetical protein